MNIFNHIIIGSLLFSPHAVLAQEKEVDISPYTLSQNIPTEYIPREECIVILRNEVNNFDQEVTIKDLENQMIKVKSEISRINESIEEIENGDNDSIITIKYQLENIIENLFEEYYVSIDNFEDLSEEEQLQIIKEDAEFIEWQAYLLSLESTLNDLLDEKDSLLKLANQIEYDIEIQKNTSNNNNKYRQCRLYPYSVGYHSTDIQSEIDFNVGLADFLLQIDSIMKEIVPKDYLSIKYKDIKEIFEVTYKIEPNQISKNKNNIKFDESSLNLYSYAKKIGMYEIESMAHSAYEQFLVDNNSENYIQNFRIMNNLKNEQYLYFEAINQETFELLKENLCVYLNQNKLFDEDTYKKIKQFHDKYQVKLAWFDDKTNLWKPYSVSNSGFYEADETLELSKKNLNTDNNDEKYIPINEVENRDNNLEKVKNKLLKEKNKPLKKDEKQKKDKTNQEINNKKNKKLPKTGENKNKYYLPISLLLISIGFIIINQKNRI